MMSCVGSGRLGLRYVGPSNLIFSFEHALRTTTLGNTMEDTQSFPMIWHLASSREQCHLYVHPTLHSAFDSTIVA